MFLNLYSI